MEEPQVVIKQHNPELLIDTKDFDSDIINCAGHMYMEMTGKIMTHECCEGTVHKFTIHEDVDKEALMKYIKDNYNDYKAKRLEKMQTIDCKVVKYAGNYYIVDGETKVQIFE